MGFDARWGVVSAAEVGAPHKRDRIWIVANFYKLKKACRQFTNQQK
jgi:DNA (cytosine-5)-methyltransferase 1